MKTITVQKQEVDKKEFNKRTALDSDYDKLVDQNCKIVDQDGKLLAIYLPIKEDLADVEWAVQSIKYGTNDRTAGLSTTSKIFGYMPRIVMRKDYCTAVAMAAEYPRQHALIARLGELLAEYYQKYAPEVYEPHMALVNEKIKEYWRLPNSPYTSGIINKDNALKYHFDSGNFQNVFSCMVTLKNDIGGGHLALPEYRIGLKLENHSLLLFDGQSILHGVTPINKHDQERGYRYTLVY